MAGFEPKGNDANFKTLEEQECKIFEGSLAVKLPTIWADEKKRWEESEKRREEKRRDETRRDEKRREEKRRKEKRRTKKIREEKEPEERARRKSQKKEPGERRCRCAKTHHNNSPLLWCPIIETSATALRGSTGSYDKSLRHRCESNPWVLRV